LAAVLRPDPLGELTTLPRPLAGFRVGYGQGKRKGKRKEGRREGRKG